MRVTSVRSDALPRLSLSATAGHAWVDTGSLADGDVWSGRVFLSVPLLTGFEDTYLIRQAEDNAALAAAQAQGLEQQAILEVWVSSYGLRTATQLVRTSRDLLASATQSEAVALGRYKAGVGTIIDVLAAQSALATARAQEVQARAGWFLALAQLAGDTGAAAPNFQAAVTTVTRTLTNLSFTQHEIGPVNIAFLWNETEAEHLYLVTSAQTLEEAQTWYRRRFKIETLFSDTKSRGFGLDKSGIRHPERMARFVIAIFLAYIWMISGGVSHSG